MAYENPFYIGMISTIPPRQCGIATFNWDFYESIKNDERICDKGFYSIIREHLNYEPTIARFIEKEIEQGNKKSWKESLEDIIEKTNYRKDQGIRSGFFIQHEYGIFGENHETDDNVVCLLENLHKHHIPNITITHTVLSNPNKHKEKVMKGMLEYTDKIICLSPSVIHRLMERYNAPRGKLIYIPHGVPRMEIEETRSELKRKYNLVNNNSEKTVVSTIGFLSAGKGLEYAIKSFSQVLNSKKSKRNNLIYLIAGETHPEIKRKEGERYRNNLIKLCKKEKLKPIHIKGKRIPNLKDHNVVFLNRYLDKEELLKIKKMSDVGLVTNLGREQISSGQIAYWVGMGRTVIATESPYAKDMENEGIGLLVKFENSEEITDRLNFFLNLSKEEKQELEFLASDKGVTMSWPIVGLEMLNLMENIINQHNGTY